MNRLSSNMNQSIVLFTGFLIGSILFLIFLGALVKSNEAGLSVPDWPASYGYNMFLFPYSQWIGGVFYEHSHRLVASGVGALTVILTIWLFVTKTTSLVKKLGALAILVVCAQGVLGGLTVIYQLPAIISVSHGVLAQTFLIIITTIYALLNPPKILESNFSRSTKSAVSLTSKVLLVSIVALFTQLLLGAFMRHLEAGLAILDFPTMGGKLNPVPNQELLVAANIQRSNLSLPPVNYLQLSTHLAHRLWSVVVFSLILISSYKIIKLETLKPYRRLAYFLFSLIIIQMILGISTILSIREPLVTSLHVLIGAVTLSLTWYLFIRTRQVLLG